MSKYKNRIINIVLFVAFLVGLSVAFYPVISNWWNEKHTTVAIADYVECVNNMSEDKKAWLMEQARDYNRKLAELSDPFTQYDEIEGYEDILDVSGTGIMGYINIPMIGGDFPIYHGTSPEVLNVAAGHLQGSSLPIGGSATHAVISAHRGLPTAKLFTDLDKLEKGDMFSITILDETLTYLVDDIQVVEPEDMNKLAVIENEDHVTLMTCTPYGINTHRLLVRGKRIETVNTDVKEYNITGEAVQIDEDLIAVVIFVIITLVLVLKWSLADNVKNKLGGRKR